MRTRGLVAWLMAAAFTASLLQAPAVQARTPDRDDHPAGVRQAPAVNIDFFYDSLAPYGEWIDLPQWGWAWYPDGVPVGWQPYTVGHWVLTDWGWTWVSDFDWGWGPFHYGRWVDNDDYGWLWIPGFDWGPAWVAWDLGDDWIGWAPLPPVAEWDPDEGLRFSDRDLERRIPDRDFAFVREGDLTDHDLRNDIIPRARNVSIVPLTHDVTRYESVGGVPVDRSVSPQRIERVEGHPISRLPVDEVRSVRQLERERSRRGEAVPLFRPTINHEKRLEPPRSKLVSPDTERGRAQLQAMRSRHAAEEHALAQHHAEEQRRMEEFHRQELAQAQNHTESPPPAHGRAMPRGERMMHQPRGEEVSPGASAAQLQRQQEREMQFMREQQQREMHQMQTRHQWELSHRFEQLQPERTGQPERHEMREERPHR